MFFTIRNKPYKYVISARQETADGDHASKVGSDASWILISTSEVTIEIHAVSLQASNSLSRVDMLLNLCSRSAVISIWIIADMDGALEHVCGDLAEEIKANALGGDADAVLRKYINSIIRIPDLLSYEEASTLPCATLTAMKRGDYVLALQNRHFAAQIALASGANVIHRMNCKKMPNWDEEITGGRGITGGSNTLQQSSGAVKDSGCVHVISFVSGGKQEIPDMNRLFTARNPHPVVESLLFPTGDRRVDLESQKHVGEVVTRVSKD
ncbi:hypothetical protein BKA82DRAFT_4376936 [Pisolithus tinctorius]|nr:hypothetical protein BKA82DRAFT_4376936 [Pisolithus tinctorius]